MLPFYSFNFLVMVGAAIFFYRAAVFEESPAWIWTGLSIAISVVIWQALHWGLLSLILGQVGLYLGIWIYRIIRKQ
jgi:hypothetical protein